MKVNNNNSNNGKNEEKNRKIHFPLKSRVNIISNEFFLKDYILLGRKINYMAIAILVAIFVIRMLIVALMLKINSLESEVNFFIKSQGVEILD